MSVEDIIERRVKKVGITPAELARRCSMKDGLLRRSLRGKRILKGVELVVLCNELDMTLGDFDELVKDRKAS